jgi:hypothetical protein
MERVECHGKAPSPFLFPLFVYWPLIEERDLLRIGRQAGEAYGHQTETDSTAETPLEERREVRRKVHFPTRLRGDPLMLRHFELIAVADHERQTPAHAR